MPDTQTATGVCVEVSEKSGWTTFHIDTGGKWPVKLSTKKSEIIDAARSAGNEYATWQYTEKESETINEHTGKPYVNKYLEGVSLDGDEGVAQQAQESLNPSRNAEPARKPLLGGDKDRAITRMACLKAAAETVRGTGLGPDDDPALEVMKVAQRYETWVMRDIGPLPEQLQ